MPNVTSDMIHHADDMVFSSGDGICCVEKLTSQKALARLPDWAIRVFAHASRCRQTSILSRTQPRRHNMAEDMSLHQVPLTLIVAATVKNGIGKNGGLPWPMLKKEMAYFARVTKRVPMPKGTGSLQSDALKTAILDGTRRNVVIMGRKTWESIPPRFRPLKDRTSIVISSQGREKLGNVPRDVIVASDISSGLGALEQAIKDDKAPPVGRAFVIGGSSIYKAALKMDQAKHILLTRIQKNYECDTFFPITLDAESNSSDGWQRSSRDALQDFVGEETAEVPDSETHDGEEVQYEFQLYERP